MGSCVVPISHVMALVNCVVRTFRDIHYPSESVVPVSRTSPVTNPQLSMECQTERGPRGRAGTAPLLEIVLADSQFGAP